MPIQNQDPDLVYKLVGYSYRLLNVDFGDMGSLTIRAYKSAFPREYIDLVFHAPAYARILTQWSDESFRRPSDREEKEFFRAIGRPYPPSDYEAHRLFIAGTPDYPQAILAGLCKISMPDKLDVEWTEFTEHFDEGLGASDLGDIARSITEMSVDARYYYTVTGFGYRNKDLKLIARDLAGDIARQLTFHNVHFIELPMGWTGGAFRQAMQGVKEQLLERLHIKQYGDQILFECETGHTPAHVVCSGVLTGH
jgi:hypothetical protein